MKAAYLTEFIDDKEIERGRMEAIKHKYNNPQILAVMSGDFLVDGTFPDRTKADRKEMARVLGIDHILEMGELSCVSSSGIYGFSLARILDNMGDIDVLVMEVEGADYDRLLEIAFILIKNERDFQKRITAFKKAGMSFYRAQAQAVGELVEDGERIMLSLKNILAVETILALKIMYSSIKCDCIDIAGEADSAERTGEAAPEDIVSSLQHAFAMDEEGISDIYGGYDRLSRRIADNADKFENFEQFARLIAGTDCDIWDIRKFLIRMAKGIRKNDILSWRLHDFSTGYILE